MIARGDAFHAGTHLGDDAGALVAAENRKAGHRDTASHQVVVGVAHPGRFHLDLDFVLPRVADLDFLDRPRLVELPDQRALCFHERPPSACPDPRVGERDRPAPDGNLERVLIRSPL